MDIIPVIDILDNKVVKAHKGDRNNYEPINHQLYNSTAPRDIIYQIVKKYSPNIIYIADLDAIINNQVNHSLFKLILQEFSKIDFWIDTGLNEIKLYKKYKNYHPVFCSEKSKGFELKSNKYNNYICSYDFLGNYLGGKPIFRHKNNLISKFIIMDLLQVGSNQKMNYRLAKRFIRNNKCSYYIAGGVKSALDIIKAKKVGASGVLVSSIIHQNILSRNMIQKEKTSSK